MIGRRQLPVHSPLPLGAVLAALGRDDPRRALAAELRGATGAADVLLTSSGTHALTLALLAASARRPGLPFALPGYACYDLVTAAVGAGIPVRLYDLDPRTLAPEPTSLARALEGGAAALVVVHLFGVPVPMDAMRAAAERADALLVEDAAQGTGAQWSGRPLGSWGDLGVLSFGRGKGETGGGGGALLVHEGGLLPREPRTSVAESEASRVLPTAKLAAKLAAQWALGRDWLYWIPAAIPALRLGETIYHEPTPPRSMASANARVLARTRPLATAEANVRRANAGRLQGALTDQRMVVAPVDADGAGWLRFPLVPAAPLELGEDTSGLGIARGYPLPLAEVPALRPLLGRSTPSTPGATHLAAALVTLPTHSRLSERALCALERWLGSLTP